MEALDVDVLLVLGDDALAEDVDRERVLVLEVEVEDDKCRMWLMLNCKLCCYLMASCIMVSNIQALSTTCFQCSGPLWSFFLSQAPWSTLSAAGRSFR